MIELAMIVVIDCTALAQGIFGTAPVPAQAWALVVPFAVQMLGLEQGRKAVVRRHAMWRNTVS
jgi:hypothetical protein